MKNRILIVDDEEAIRFSLKNGLSDAGYEVITCEKGEEVIEKIEKWSPHLVLLDIRLPDKNGFDVLIEIKRKFSYIQVVMMTAYGDTQGTVKAIKLGATDFIDKPFDFERLLLTIDKSLQSVQIKKEWEYYHERYKEDLIKNQIIGESDLMKAVIEKIKIVAENDDTTVLITGETGTGKEVAAKAIHILSNRADKPFIDINCGAIPENLLESELFGHEKHAFTGAGEGKKGLFELADGGTVFLDEIGEMSLEMQVKLLRFLETRKFRRVGSNQNIFVDVRVIAATNRNLKIESEERRFRSDLFYRLNVFPVTMPPLREIKNDIPIFIKYFWQEGSFSENALEVLYNYKWPGNVRELKNILERLSILYTDKIITVEDLPLDLLNTGSLELKKRYQMIEIYDNKKSEEEIVFPMEGLERELEKVEKMYIKKALEETRWNISKAAKLLKISRHILQRRVEKYFSDNSV